MAELIGEDVMTFKLSSVNDMIPQGNQNFKQARAQHDSKIRIAESVPPPMFAGSDIS